MFIGSSVGQGGLPGGGPSTAGDPTSGAGPNPHLQKFQRGQAAWNQAHSYAGIPMTSATRPEEQAGVMPGDAMRNIRLARQGLYGPVSAAARAAGNVDENRAYDALEGLQRDFAPIREARSALQGERSQLREAAPDARAAMRPDLRQDRLALQSARRSILPAERRGLTPAEFAARRASRAPSMGGR